MQEAADGELSGRAQSSTAPNSTRNSYIVNGKPLLLQRTSSLAELAREHKRQREPQNDVRKFFLDGDGAEEESPQLLDQTQDNYFRWRQPAPEHSNLLYRTGSRLAVQAGLEIGEGYEPHKYGNTHVRRPRSQQSSVAPSRSGSLAPSSDSSESSSDSESSDRVLHVGRNFRSDTIMSDISVSDEAKWPWSAPRLGWIATALGFSSHEPASAAEKVWLREKSTGYDPALALAIAVAIFT